MNTYKLIATIKSSEGFRDDMYDDATGASYQHGTAPKGTLTVGWGHNCELAFPLSVLEMLLQNDVSIAVSNVRRVFPNQFDDFNDTRQRALVEIMFNLGAGTFSTFHNMIEAIRREAWISASASLLDSDYARELPQRVDRLARMLRTGTD